MPVMPDDGKIRAPRTSAVRGVIAGRIECRVSDDVRRDATLGDHEEFSRAGRSAL
jgi:hypothetical protein